MPSVIDHYETLLAQHYSWLLGGVEPKVEENRNFFIFEFYQRRSESGQRSEMLSGCLNHPKHPSL